MEIRGRIAIVSGASSGIGAATARALAASGARVVLLARSRGALDAVAADITAKGAEAHVFVVDLADPAAVATTADLILSTVGVPDIVVHNAGAGQLKSIVDTAPHEVVAMTAVPYFGAFFLTQRLLPAMMARHSGHFVVVTSPAGFAGVPGGAAYATARWAMRGFAEQLRAELDHSGLGVTLMVPGQVDTPYFDHNPGSLERLPRIATMRWLYPLLTADQVARDIVRAIDRESVQVVTPFAMGLTLVASRWFPRFVQWLVTRTGHRAT